jgi:hypothetical protein
VAWKEIIRNLFTTNQMEGDFNSPELFNKGLEFARQQLQTINKLANNVLTGM